MHTFFTYCEANWQEMEKDKTKVDAALAHFASAQAKADASSVYGKRIALRSGEAFRELEVGRGQPVKRRVRELDLLLDPERSDGPELPSRLDRVLEQCRLADARLSVHHEHAAVPAACGFEEPVERLALAAPSEQMLSRRVNR